MPPFKTKEQYDEESKNPILKVTFNISVAEGVLKLPQEGTAQVLEEILKRYNSEGVTLDSARGFTWYPSHAIRKVDVEIQ